VSRNKTETQLKVMPGYAYAQHRVPEFSYLFNGGTARFHPQENKNSGEKRK